MNRRARLILRHTCETLLLAVAAGVIVVALQDPMTRFFQPFADGLAPWGVWGLLGLVLLVFAVVAVTNPRSMLAVLGSLRFFPVHHGLVVKGLLALAITLGLRAIHPDGIGITPSLIPTVLVIALCVLGLAIGYGVARAVKAATIGTRQHPAARTVDLQERLPDKLAHWLVQDRPLERAEESLLPDHSHTAERILSRILSAPDSQSGLLPTVALVGPYGSGKTSICNLVSFLYSSKVRQGDRLPKIIFRRFEAWQYLTPDAALRGLMECAVGAVTEAADMSDLWRLPEKYVKAVKEGAGGLIAATATFLGGRLDPRAVLSRISDVLVRLDMRILIFVDDFDRVEGTSPASQEALAQSLNHFQNLPNIQYVIAVGPPPKGARDQPERRPVFDLLKLTRYQELVPRLGGESILAMVRQLRQSSMSHESYFYPWSELAPQDRDPLEWNRWVFFPPMPSSLAGILTELLNTPRGLKCALRDAWAAWTGGLNGEISWYDLMLACSLRVAEPAVFEWIERERELFLSGPDFARTLSDEAKKQVTEQMRQEIGRRMVAKDMRRSDAVIGALEMLFPAVAPFLGTRSSGSVEPDYLCQSLAYSSLHGRPILDRFLSGGIGADDIPDQPTLRFVRQALSQGLNPEGFQDRYLSSYEKLTGALNKFVQFSGLLTTELALQVAGTILKWVADPANARSWPKPEEFIHSVALDGYFIILHSGEGERRRRAARRTNDREGLILGWLRSVVEQYAGSQPLVAAEALHLFSPRPGSTGFSFREEEVGPLWQDLAEALRHHFVEGNLPLLPRLGFGRSDLFRFNLALCKHQRYSDFKTQYTRRVVAEAQADQSQVLKSKIIISLVNYSHPVMDGEPPVDRYTFSVDPKANAAVYDMDVLLPALREWANRAFPDPVVSRALVYLDQTWLGAGKLQAGTAEQHEDLPVKQGDGGEAGGPSMNSGQGWPPEE